MVNIVVSATCAVVGPSYRRRTRGRATDDMCDDGAV